MSTFSPDILAAAMAAPIAPAIEAPAKPRIAGIDSDMIELSRAVDFTGPVFVPGMVRPFLPHQAAAFEYMKRSIASWGGTLLGYDMGLGKTQMMLAMIAQTLHDKGGYALLIGPTVAKTSYMNDLRDCFPHLRFAHLHGRKPRWECSRCRNAIVPVDDEGNVTVRACGLGGDCTPMIDIPAADIYFLSDDPQTLAAWLVTKFKRGHKQDGYRPTHIVADATILCRDEIHRDKGINGQFNKSIRSHLMHEVCESMRDRGAPVIGATGTLLLNKVVESLVPLLMVGGPKLVTTLTPGSHQVTGYLYRYCAPKKIYVPGKGYKTDFSGVDLKEVHKLHEYLRGTVYPRIEKSDLPRHCEDGHRNASDATECVECGKPVISILPHSSWLVLPVAISGGDKEAQKAMRDYVRYANDFLAMVLENEGPEAYFRKARMEAVQRMMKLWELAGVAKAEVVSEYVEELCDQGRQVVVFFEHHSVRDAVIKRCAKAGRTYDVIDGSNTGDRRVDTIEEFQAGNTDVILVNHKSGGVAVTLTAAADAVFAQVCWSAGLLKQMADRILRVDARSQARARAGESVRWHVIQTCLPDGTPSLDAHLWSVLERKAKVCDALNAGREITMSDEDIEQAVLTEWFQAAAAARKR